MVRITRDEMMLQICSVVSGRSTCQRAQVGAVIAREGRIISIGYNGPAAGVPECKVCTGPGCSISCHAEANAIIYAAKVGVSVRGCTLYCTYSPCLECSKLIVNSGIRSVIYERAYRDRRGIDFLKLADVTLERSFL